jgi:hypothetical protein
MEDTNWIVPAIFGLIVLIGAVTFLIHMISEAAKVRRNRIYKSLDEHRMLNASGLNAPGRHPGAQ